MHWLPPHFIARNAIISFGLQGYAKLAFVLTNMLLAHQLSLEDYGLYSTIISWVSMGVGCGLLGLPWIITRTLSVTENNASLSSFHKQFARQIGATLFVMPAVITVMYDESDAWLLYLTIVPLTLINGWLEYCQAIFTGLKQITAALVPKQLIAPTAQLLLLAVLFIAFPQQASIGWVVAVIGISWLLACVPTLKLRRKTAIAAPTNAAKAHDWWISSLAVLSVLQNVSGVIVLSLMAGLEEVAIFAAVLRIRDVMVFCLRAVIVPFSPRISEHVQERNVSAIRDKYLKALFVSTAFALPLLLISLFAPVELLSMLFSEKYTAAINTLWVITAGTFFGLLAGPCGQVLLMMREDRFAAILKLFSFGVGLAVMVLLVPAYGAFGAAMGFIADLIINTLGSFGYMAIRLRRKQFI